MNTLYQIFYLDLWVPIWPNLAASAIVFLPAFWWHHSRMIKKLEHNHAKLMTKVESVLGAAQKDLAKAVDAKDAVE